MMNKDMSERDAVERILKDAGERDALVEEPWDRLLRYSKLRGDFANMWCGFCSQGMYTPETIYVAPMKHIYREGLVLSKKDQLTVKNLFARRKYGESDAFARVLRLELRSLPFLSPPAQTILHVCTLGFTHARTLMDERVLRRLTLSTHFPLSGLYDGDGKLVHTQRLYDKGQCLRPAGGDEVIFVCASCAFFKDDSQATGENYWGEGCPPSLFEYCAEKGTPMVRLDKVIRKAAQEGQWETGGALSSFVTHREMFYDLDNKGIIFDDLLQLVIPGLRNATEL